MNRNKNLLILYYFWKRLSNFCNAKKKLSYTYGGLYVPLNFFSSSINKTMKKIFYLFLADDLSIRRPLTDNLSVRKGLLTICHLEGF